MMERVEAEVALVRCRFPDVEFRVEDLWARIPAYALPEGWGRASAELAFQVPRDVFGQQPYGFWVRPPLALPGGGPPTNTSGPVATAFGDGWQQFSWAPEIWQPGPDPRCGSNLFDFVQSFAHRLAEVN
jgi:Prokaryotic E2 family E